MTQGVTILMKRRGVGENPVLVLSLFVCNVCQPKCRSSECCRQHYIRSDFATTVF